MFDRQQNADYTSRVDCLLVTMLGMCLSHALVFLQPSRLVLASVVIGLNFGGMFALAPIILG